MQVYILAKDYTKLIKVHIIINLINVSKKCALVWSGRKNWNLKSVYKDRHLTKICGCWHGFPQGVSMDNVGYNIFWFADRQMFYM